MWFYWHSLRTHPILIICDRESEAKCSHHFCKALPYFPRYEVQFQSIYILTHSLIQIRVFVHYYQRQNPRWHRPRALVLFGTVLLRSHNSCLRLMSMEWDVLWTNCKCHLQRRYAVPQFCGHRELSARTKIKIVSCYHKISGKRLHVEGVRVT